MIDLQQAIEIARKHVQEVESVIDIPCALILPAAREGSYGWVFCYNSFESLETDNFRLGLVGNAPFIVDRENGKITVTGTAHEIDHYIREYEAEADHNGNF